MHITQIPPTFTNKKNQFTVEMNQKIVMKTNIERSYADLRLRFYEKTMKIQNTKKNNNQANGLASKGAYEAGTISSYAGDASLFVKAHSY